MQYTGPIRMDSDKVVLTQLVTFDCDTEFLDSCPKIDMSKR